MNVELHDWQLNFNEIVCELAIWNRESNSYVAGFWGGYFPVSNIACTSQWTENSICQFPRLVDTVDKFITLSEISLFMRINGHIWRAVIYWQLKKKQDFSCRWQCSHPRGRRERFGATDKEAIWGQANSGLNLTSSLWNLRRDQINILNPFYLFYECLGVSN